MCWDAACGGNSPSEPFLYHRIIAWALGVAATCFAKRVRRTQTESYSMNRWLLVYPRSVARDVNERRAFSIGIHIYEEIKPFDLVIFLGLRNAVDPRYFIYHSWRISFACTILKCMRYLFSRTLGAFSLFISLSLSVSSSMCRRSLNTNTREHTPIKFIFVVHKYKYTFWLLIFTLNIAAKQYIVYDRCDVHSCEHCRYLQKWI